MTSLLLSTERTIDAATRTRRHHLLRQLAGLPDEAFTRLQYLQVQIGCFNRCTFCSQQAGTDIWQVSDTGLGDLVAALAGETRRRRVRLGGDRDAHRPGVLFPYLDNDISSYDHLLPLVRHCADDLGVRLRLSTVGYSRHHRRLTAAHQRIVAAHRNTIDGIRFSLTPYAVGYRTNRDAYLSDLAAALRTWRPYIDEVGAGAATAAIELRFPPLLHAGTGALYDEIVDGRHVIASAPHLLVSTSTVSARPAPTTIAGVTGRETSFSRRPESYLHLISDRVLADGHPAEMARLALDGMIVGAHRIRPAAVHAWVNADGPYYAVDPTFTLDGRYEALHLYPRTGRRHRSGYTDATRHFLSALLAVKAAAGIGRRAPFADATRADVRTVLYRLGENATKIGAVDQRAATHITRQVLPLATALARVLDDAGYPPSAFFDRNFCIDTGQIVNQGNARALFRGLASTEDEPMTPREERGYGDVSLSSIRGTVWRIAPAPTTAGRDRSSVGGKNIAHDRPALVVEELDPQHLRPVNRATGQPLRRYVLDGVDTENLALRDADGLHAFPGAAA